MKGMTGAGLRWAGMLVVAVALNTGAAAPIESLQAPLQSWRAVVARNPALVESLQLKPFQTEGFVRVMEQTWLKPARLAQEGTDAGKASLVQLAVANFVPEFSEQVKTIAEYPETSDLHALHLGLKAAEVIRTIAKDRGSQALIETSRHTLGGLIAQKQRALAASIKQAGAQWQKSDPGSLPVADGRDGSASPRASGLGRPTPRAQRDPAGGNLSVPSPTLSPALVGSRAIAIARAVRLGVPEPEAVLTLKESPDGSRIMVSRVDHKRRLFARRADQPVNPQPLWASERLDDPEGDAIQTAVRVGIPYPETVRSVLMRRDGSLYLVIRKRGRARLFSGHLDSDATTGRAWVDEKPVWASEGRIAAAAFGAVGADRSSILIAGLEGTIQVFESKKGQWPAAPTGIFRTGGAIDQKTAPTDGPWIVGPFPGAVELGDDHRSLVIRGGPAQRK